MRRWLIKYCTRAQKSFHPAKSSGNVVFTVLFMSTFDLFECHGQPRNIVKAKSMKAQTLYIL
jgi:hypothetical protein